MSRFFSDRVKKLVAYFVCVSLLCISTEDVFALYCDEHKNNLNFEAPLNSFFNFFFFFFFSVFFYLES